MTPLRCCRTVLGVLALFSLQTQGAMEFISPPTEIHPVTNTYFGTAVVDNYQWLENPAEPAVKAWVAAQNRITRAYLDSLTSRSAIAGRLRTLYSGSSANYSSLEYRPGRIFAMRFQPPAQQPVLVRLNSAEDPSSQWTVLDPNRISPSGALAIDFAVASVDGRRVAVSLSENGSEDGTLFFYDTATGQPLPDKIPGVQFPTAGGSVAWNGDGTGVFYTRYPRKGERPDKDLHFFQQIYFHRLGTPATEDKYSLGRDFPRIAEITLETRRDGRYVLATIANGDGGEYAIAVLGPSQQWQAVSKFSDEIKMAKFGADEGLYLLSRLGAPSGKIVRVGLDDPNLEQARTIVPPSAAAIENFCPATNGIYVQEMVGGPSQIRLFGTNSAVITNVPIKLISSVQEMLLVQNDSLLFKNTTFIDPYIWMIFNPTTMKTTPTALAGTSPANFSQAEVLREFATSRDGTKIPLNIICRKGLLLNSNNPTLLYGYGGYKISLAPNFNVARSLWLEQGGVYVVANIRGGGEYGDEWHTSGNLTKKQNVFDDFAACAQYLCDRGYTRPARLAVEGGSNGGLLMGAFLTQHPGMARAVVSHVGIYDSLRSELEPNGEFNITEFGSVKVPDQFAALYAYSPYHHVVDGTRYPAVLLMTGDNDGRVNPFHSRKMAARLQAANRSDHPILLRTTAAAGHGIGSSLDERIAEQADAYAFLFDQLGITYDPMAR